MNALPAALNLAAQHVPVFPCSANKKPTCPHGFRDATADPVTVRNLWRRYPGPLVGMPTGSASGIDVLDLDFRNGAQPWLDANRYRLPATRTHVTRSGGQHMLFRADPRASCSASKIAVGVDVRARGGYVIRWDATGLPMPVERPLAPWPEWLVRLIVPSPEPASAPSLAAARAPSMTDAERIITSVLHRVETAVQGQRHHRLRNAALTIGGLIGACGLNQSEASRVLLDAVVRAGGDAVDRDNARATIAWGLQQGATRPLAMEARHAGQ